MKKHFIVAMLLLCFFSLPAFSQVVINEVMYAPVSPNKEWFELYNGGSSPVSIQNWKWRDAAASNPIRTITTQNISIQPGGFVLVCEDTANVRSVFPNAPGILIQSIGWNALNNTGSENLVVYNSAMETMDSLTYSNSWGGSSGGYSLEKKNPLGPTNDPSNWGTSIASDKATPNQPNSLLPRQYDLWLKSFTISPSNPQVGNTLTLNFLISNLGTNAAPAYTLNIYYDLNRNGIPEPSELINAQPGLNLAPNDSAAYNFQIQNIDSGLKQYIGRVEFALDQDTTNNTLIRSVNVGGPPPAVSDVVINEIMYTPTDANNEWFELYNKGSQSVNINNWKWRDLQSSTLRTVTTSDIFIQPSGYLIVCQDSAKFKTRFPSATGTIVQSSGWSGLNNSGSDGVTLYNSSGSIVDSVIYTDTWGGQGGFSLERRLAAGSSNDQSNWGSSTANDKATPNRVNSITPKPYDVSLSSFTISPQFPAEGETVVFNFLIKNPGINAASNFTLNIYNDVNFDSIPNPAELVNSNTFGNLNSDDSVSYSYSIPNIDSGYKQYMAILVYTPDEDTSNNKIVKNFNVGGEAGGNFVINEIMFDPLTGYSEWVELFNGSGQTINIRNYKFNESSNTYSFSPSADLFINPGDYIVLAHDTTVLQRFPYLRNPEPNQYIFYNSSLSLSNSGETLTFSDSLGNILDQVSYLPNWKNPNISDAKGISLERINPSLGSNDRDNWSSCADAIGGTPGRRNSIYTPVLPSTGTVTVSPNPFSPDGDGFEDVAIVKYQLTVPFAQMRVKVFDIKGRLVRTLANNQITGNQGTIIFNGLDDSGQKLRIGIYILFIEAINDQGGQVDVIKAPVVVGAKL